MAGFVQEEGGGVVKLPSVRTIAVDAMGADLGPREVVAGVADVYAKVSDFGNVILVGDEAILTDAMKEFNLHRNARVQIKHATEVIEMHEKPVQSIRQKRDASMVRAIELVCDGKADAIFSCGNTGSLMAAGTLKLRTIPGIERPALAVLNAMFDKTFVLLDVGANPDSTARHLVHNAVLGYHYARVALHKPAPRVGLLTIGTEEGKGNERVNTAHEQLKKLGHLIDYRGLIEGFQVFEDNVDVIVCDGFVGNVLLKTCEGLLMSAKNFFKQSLMKNMLRKLGALLAMGAFKDVKEHLDTETHAGAPLLGLKGIVVKAHGSSTRRAVMHALELTHEMAVNDLTAKMFQSVDQANQTLSV